MYSIFNHPVFFDFFARDGYKSPPLLFDTRQLNRDCLFISNDAFFNNAPLMGNE